MIKKILIKVLFVSSILFLISCTPDEMQITLYTSDIDSVRDGEVINLPVKISFSMPGDDKNNDLEKARNIAKNYLPLDTKFSISKGQYSQYFIVDTTLPFQSKNIGNRQIGGFLYLPKPGKQDQGQIKLIFNDDVVKEIDSLLRNLNFMLSLNLPPKTYKLRIISDSKVMVEINSYSAWISKKPHVEQVTSLKRREEVELIFKGGSSSIYSQIPIFIDINKK
tara:strand:+ start:237 stop:902 length:666 start_codon:yes stop_codon:yes gene_type:complete